MKIEIQPNKINKQPCNQVTSSEIFKKNQRRISNDFRYHEDGLFSERIFGKFNHCKCGELHEEGICEICGCRVIKENNIPDFFIDLGASFPKLFANYGEYKDVKELLEYGAYLYLDEENNEYQIFSLDEGFDEDILDPTSVKIGLDAARVVHPDIDKWADQWMTDFINVPHPVFRPNLRLNDGKVSFSPINKALVGILQNLNFVKQYKDLFEDDPKLTYFLLSFYRTIYEYYTEGMKEIFNIFCKSKKSFVSSDLKSHRLTSAIRGTVLNRYDLDEDVILIGDTFISTLYPYLYKIYEGDMEKINNHLVMNEERVLVNRPPTICHLSIVAMKPRVASCYKFGTFDDGGLGSNPKSEYDEENDTLGVRTVAVNPIMMDGLAGDFDGDTLFVIPVFTDKAKQEANTMLPSGNFMNYASGNIRNAIIEDIEYVRGK